MLRPTRMMQMRALRVGNAQAGGRSEGFAVNDRQFRQVVYDPFGWRIDPADASAGFGILDHAHPVIDEFADVDAIVGMP